MTISRLPPRAADSHKGSYGRVLIIAGSRGLSGAAVLAGRSALRGGAGLVQVAVPAPVQDVVSAGEPCYTTAGLPADAAGRFTLAALEELLTLAARADVVALGPGLGQSDDLQKLVPQLLERLRVPVVLDADGLNALVGQANVLAGRPAPTIITPHPGEFARLLGRPIADRTNDAATFARDHRCIVVLKGHRSVVTDGMHTELNDTGNPGMATGGSGDILTGLTAALLGQRPDTYAAARLATHVHGRAGDLAAATLGQVALVATDLLHYLPGALCEVSD